MTQFIPPQLSREASMELLRLAIRKPENQRYLESKPVPYVDSGSKLLLRPRFQQDARKTFTLNSE